MMKILPDINVWLALAFESHAHHLTARNWLQTTEDDDVIYFCRMTQQGFLRIATNTKAFGAEALSMNAAWNAYDAFLADGRITTMDESQRLELEWRRWTAKDTRSTDKWSDAFLAAFAICADMHFVTFDRGFQEYAGLKLVTLS